MVIYNEACIHKHKAEARETKTMKAEPGLGYRTYSKWRRN